MTMHAMQARELGVSDLFKGLESNSTQKRDESLAALKALSQTAEQQRAIAAAGGINPLVALLDDTSTQEHAAATLMNLAFEASNRSAIANSPGALASLVLLLSSSSKVVQRRAAGAMKNLCLNHAGNRTKLLAACAAPPLVRLLSSADAAVQQRAAGALKNLAANSSASRSAITAANAIAPLTSMLSSTDARVIKQALGALQNLVHGNAAALPQLKAAGTAAKMRQLARGRAAAHVKALAMTARVHIQALRGQEPSSEDVSEAEDDEVDEDEAPAAPWKRVEAEGDEAESELSSEASGGSSVCDPIASDAPPSFGPLSIMSSAIKCLALDPKISRGKLSSLHPSGLAAGGSGRKPTQEDDAASLPEPSLQLWDLEAEKTVTTICGILDQISEINATSVCSLCYNADGTQLAVAGEDGSIWLLNLQTGTVEVFSFATFSDGAHNDGRWDNYGVAFSHDGTKLLQYGNDDIFVWDLKSEDPKYKQQEFGRDPDASISTFLVQGAAFSADDSTIVAFHLKNIKTWSAQGELLSEFEFEFDDSGASGTTPSCFHAAICPEGRLLAAAFKAGYGGYEERAVHVYDIAAKKRVFVLEGHDAEVECLAFSPESDAASARLVTGGVDGVVKLWDVSTLHKQALCVGTLEAPETDQGAGTKGGIGVTSIACGRFHTRSNWRGVRVAIGRADGRLQVLRDTDFEEA